MASAFRSVDPVTASAGLNGETEKEEILED